jgi:hypothetical protein
MHTNQGGKNIVLQKSFYIGGNISWPLSTVNKDQRNPMTQYPPLVIEFFCRQPKTMTARGAK